MEMNNIMAFCCMRERNIELLDTNNSDLIKRHITDCVISFVFCGFSGKTMVRFTVIKTMDFLAQ